jgi:tetratricopeptide (TPR) repeat protein
MLVTFAAPFLLVAAVELALRLSGYGPDLSLFVTESMGGRPYLIMNPDVKNRYFARVDFTPSTSYDAFALDKTPGTFRIFCLGGSTTAGFPYGIAGSFSSFLRDRLHRLFPERQIEVVNLGMTATNSFTALDIVRELDAAHPDLIIVYDGHNEFYGALGTASRESAGGSRWITLLTLQLVHSRIYLLARDLYHRLTAGTPESAGQRESGTLMERLAHGQYISYGDPAYVRTRETFRDNLEDITAYCASHAIPLILSTQVSNLRDRPPFVSGAATGTDTTSAATWFTRARALDTRGRYAGARHAYERARDLDRLRFRTSGDFNDVIRSFAGRPPVTVVDIDRLFAEASPDSIVGGELILEHLHPNLRGYALMARAYAAEMRARGLLAAAEAWKQRDTLDDGSGAPVPSMTALDSIAADRRITQLTSGWPFSPGNSHAVQADAGPLEPVLRDYLHAKLTWEQAHVAAARAQEAAGDTAAAIAEYRVLINQLPQNTSAYLILAQLLIRTRRLDEAQMRLRQALAIEPGYFAYRSLGGLALHSGAVDSALFHLRHALARAATPREQCETGFLLAAALQRAGKHNDARSAARQVLAIDSSFSPARSLLRHLGESSP